MMRLITKTEIKIQEYGWRKIQTYKVPFFAALFAGLLVHFQMYSNNLRNPDALWSAEYQMAGTWELGLGRWALHYLDKLQGGLNAPFLNTFGLMLCFSLAGALLTELFDIKSRLIQALASISVICAPMVSMCITYYYCSDAYALAFLLSVASVACVAKAKRARHGIFWGGLCLAFSLGIYQSNIGVTAALSVMLIVLCISQHPEKFQTLSLKLFVRLLAMGVFGVGTYFAILEILLKINHITLNSYHGANNVGLTSILNNIPSTVKYTYVDFINYYSGTEISANSYAAWKFYAVFFSIAALGLVLLLWRIRKHPISIMAIGLLLAVLPIACNLIEIVAPNNRIILLTSGGMLLVVPFCLALISSEMQTSVEREKMLSALGKVILQYMTVLIAVGLLWSYTLQDNTDAVYMQTTQTQTISLATRICAQLESNKDYHGADSTLCIAGKPEDGNYNNPLWRIAGKCNGYAKWGLIWNSYNGSINDWNQVFRFYLGVNVKACSQDQYKAIVETPKFQTMPNYPADGSIETIDGVLVVKVSDTKGWEK